MTKRLNLRQLGLILILLMSIISQSAMALSLGEINVRSFFAEPFLAEIALPSYTIDEMDSIEIHIASTKQHLTMGYELSEASKAFRFTVKENNNGNLYIEVRTKSAIKELSISLLIEVTSINGRIIKGYDILLSPKNISGNKHTATMQVKRTQQKAQAAQSPFVTKKIVKNNTSPSTDRSKIRKLENGGFEYHGVTAGESLSRIAQRIRPEKSMHMYQVMVALYKENQNSFLDGNINILKAGTNLKLENIDEITDISQSQAFKLIQQYAGLREAATVNFDISDSSGLPETADTINNGTILLADISTDDLQSQQKNINTQLVNAQKLIKDLGIKNKTLIGRIALLEQQINETSKLLFSTQTDSLSQTNTTSPTDDTTIMLNDGAAQITENQTNTNAVSQTPMALAAAILIIALIAVRKKTALQQLLEKLKMARQK